MKNKTDIIYNLHHIVIVPILFKELFESIDYTLGNAIIMENNIDDVNKIVEFINRNNVKDIIFVNYLPDYNTIVNELKKSHIIKVLFTKTLGSLSNVDNYSMFDTIIKLYQNKGISEIAVTDSNLYTLFKEKYNVKHILLDINPGINKNISNNSDTIGVLNCDKNDFNSYYNALSAIKLVEKKASITKYSKSTKEFIKTFSISTEIRKEDELYTNNLVNIDINFSDTSIHRFLKSMDNGIPCLVGNNDFLDDNLKRHCFINSDDDIDEISSKIKEAINNKDQIMTIYRVFRDKYTKASKELAKRFIDKQKYPEEKTYEKLISVIVPVYNTEKYLRTSLNSIVEASCDDMEVLIINDGSTDDSEKIIIEYAEKYPELIRYIKQKNGGLGNVRNTGLREAKGKYIASVDSDDTINERFFTEALEYIKDDIDVIIYDWLSIKESGESFETPAIEWSLKNKNTYEGLLYSSIMPSTCNKIMKKALIDELSIKYVEDKYEDLSTNPLVLLKAKTIKYINKPYYEYYLRSGSLMRSSAGYSMIHIIKELECRLNNNKDIINIDIDELKFYTYSWRIEEFIINQLYTLDSKEITKYIDYIYDNIFNICEDIFSNTYYKEMLNKLNNKEMKEYIIERNKSIKNKEIEKFILKNRTNNYKLNASIIYYGDN